MSEQQTSFQFDRMEIDRIRREAIALRSQAFADLSRAAVRGVRNLFARGAGHARGEKGNHAPVSA